MQVDLIREIVPAVSYESSGALIIWAYCSCKVGQKWYGACIYDAALSYAVGDGGGGWWGQGTRN